VRFLKKNLLKFMFFSILSYSIYYIFFIQTEKYVSQSVVMIKDLSQGQSTSALGALLSPANSKSMTDAKLLEIYIKSSDMFKVLDKDFNLTRYYQSDSIDYLHRLSHNSPLPNLKPTNKNLIDRYNKDLKVIYDEASTTTTIEFAHANSKRAKDIVNKIIFQSSKTLNYLENENTKIILKFLEKQEKEKHKLFIESLEELLAYQNKNKTFDPKVDIEVKNKILADLESQLIKKNVEYNNKAQYLNATTPEMKLLKGNIDYIQKSINKIKSQLTGNSHNKQQKELNINMTNFMLLENRVEFNKKLYIQTLTKLEETKVLINQNRKNLIVVINAKESDSYTYPNKIKDSLSIFIILSFLYGIVGLIFMIIKDHKD